MKVKKKIFKSIKARYIADLQYSKGKASGYKKILDSYNPKYGSKDYVLERYVYHNAVVEIIELVLKDFEKLEGKL